MSSAAAFIAIDFGTSKSAMAWYDPKAGQAKPIRNAEGEEKTPSIVYFGKNETLVGTPAEQMLEDQEDPEARSRVIVSVKRSLVNSPTLALPGRRVKAVDVAAEILRKLRRDAEIGHFHQPVTRAVITYPAAFDPLQRDEIERAARLAGFSEVQLLQEPVAAAAAYTHDGFDPGNAVLVYDLGAGTLDVAVLAREGDGFFLALEPKGMAHCGGDDFDQKLYDYCDEAAQESLGRPISPTGEIDLHFLRLCRQRKETLSLQERAMFSSFLRADTGSVQFKQVIERSKLEELISPYVETSARLTKDILREAAAAGYTVDTVVLIGGSSRVPLVQTLLKQTLPVQPKEWQHRDMAVVLGAAYYAYSLWGVERVVPNGGEGLAPGADEGTARGRPGIPNSWTAQERYRQAVEMAWADESLQMEEGRQLVALAERLGLTKEEAADIERAVIGGTAEAMLERQKPLRAPARVARTLSGHTNTVYAVAFAPDSELLASGSWDKTVKLWEVASGRELRTLSGHTDRVYAAAVSPDGRLLASGSHDKTIKLWEVASGRELWTLSGHTNEVHAVAFAPDGQLLASGSGDETVKLWDVASGQQRFTFTLGTRSLRHFFSEVLGGTTSFSPDGRLVSGGYENAIRLWEVASGRELHTLGGHTDWVRCVAFAPDGRVLASGSDDGTIKLWQ
jgi:actin-like ATPase involved in cell morphogenesis